MGRDVRAERCGDGVTHEHRSADFFVLRTPLLPLDTLLAWAESGPDEDALLASLQTLAQHAEVAEALAIASADLGLALAAKPSRKVLLALARYVTRMSSRSVPFGLFAGCSVGALGEATHLALPSRSEYRRHSAAGVELLIRVSDALDEETRERAPLVPTSTRYELAGQLRYVAERDAGHPLRATRAGRELRTALALASRRLNACELAEALAHELGAPVDATQRYVAQLVASQILVPDVRPRPTANDPAREFRDRLHALGASQAATLDALADALQRIDALPIGSGTYDAAGEHLRALVPDALPSRALSVTLSKPAPELALDRRITNDILDAADVLRRLFAPAAKDPLRVFREKFRERYDTAFVPLLEALDEELGIGLPGFGPPAADDLPLLSGIPLKATPEAELFAPVHAALLARIDGPELVLTDADVERMTCDDPMPLPDSFAAIGVVANDNFVLHAITGPSGAQFVARFCNGDPRMNDAVTEWVRDEEALARDAIFAEVVALPDWRDANVVARPAFLEHEIPFFGSSSRPPEQQIEACDLLMGIRDGRLRLWSRSRNCEVIPRVTNAHNFRTRGVGAYRFFGALQRQRVAGALMWMWGPLAAMPFLPRVRYRNVVLMRARWTLAVAEVKALRGEIAARRHMPRFVLLDHSDQELLIDWENSVSIDAFLAIVGNAETIAVQELLPQPDAAPVRGPEGRFAHEVCIPFTRNVARVRKAEAPPPYSGARRFAPGGGEWLYWKLYTGHATADRVLVESVAPAMQRLGREWFFIRYSDPGHHLRIRVRGGDAGALLRELGPLFASLLESGWLAKVQLDTYVREIERYGGAEQIERIETLFAADSAAVVAALPSIANDPMLRWQVAAWGTDRLIEDLGVDKSAILDLASRALGNELDAGRATRDALARKTRETRAALDAVFGDATPRPWHAAYDERSRVIASLRLQLDDDIAFSILHMHLNRVFRSQKREQERVLYDLLLRRERSRMARV